MTPEDALDMLYCQLIDLIDDALFDVDKNQMKEYYDIVDIALRKLKQLEINEEIFENNPITVSKKIMALEIIKEYGHFDNYTGEYIVQIPGDRDDLFNLLREELE